MTIIYGNGTAMGYIKDMTTPAAHFMGEYDSNIFYNYGSVCTRRGEIWIFDGKDWYSLGSVESDMIESETIPMQYITNCPNCGAPMKNHKCIYCGTEDYGRR